jgi:hypothetical protein
MRSVVLLAFVLALPASAEAARVRSQVGERIGTLSKVVPQSGAKKKAAALQFLVTGDSSASTVSDFCDALQVGDKSGNWSCLKGSGAMATGSTFSLDPVGGPTTQTLPYCGNGASCGNVTGQRIAGASSYFQSATSAPVPAGDATLCSVFSVDSTATSQMLIGKYQGGGASIELSSTSTGMSASVNGASFATATSIGLTARARHVACLTYDYVTSGTSVMRLYFDGNPVGTPVTNAVGPLANNTTIRWTVGRSNAAANVMTGVTFGTLITEKVLSAADVLRLSQAALGTLTIPTGQALTVTRTTSRACSVPDGSSITILPPGRPCVTDGGLGVAINSTNYALTSEVLSSWSSGATTVTTDVAIGPDGARTMDRVDSSSSAGGVFRSVALPSGTAFTFSAYGAATSGTHEASLSMTCATMTSCTCYREDGTACTASSAGGECVVRSTFTTTPARLVGSVTCSSAITTTTYVLAGGVRGVSAGVHDWGYVQMEPTPATGKATPYARTEGSAVARNADNINAPLANGTQGCIAATVKWSGNASSARVIHHAGGLILGPTFAQYVDTVGGTVNATPLSSTDGRWVSMLAKYNTATPSRFIQADAVTGTSSSAFTVGAASTTYFGSFSGSAALFNGVVKDIKIDNTNSEACL